MNPYTVVKQFESELCSYTGAKHAVVVTSCTMALLLAVKWHLKDISPLEMIDEYGSPYLSRDWITVPKHTYISVPMSIIHAEGQPKFEDIEWEGMYQLKPLPVWDSARLFTSGMYKEIKTITTSFDGSCDTLTEKTTPREASQFICLSFHWSKTLAIGQGGAILHDNEEADKWFRKARFDGRTEDVAPADDTFDMIGYHCYMSPRDAADGLSRLAVLPKHNNPLPNDDYPDLSKMDIFK